MYVLIEGSPKRHAEYSECVSALGLNDGLKCLQSLSATRWSARCVNLRIVHRCLPAVLNFLEGKNDVEWGLLTALKDFKFVFGLRFLMRLFLSATAASEALQASDADLVAAGNAVEMLIESVNQTTTDDEFEQLYADVCKTCENLGISLSAAGSRRNKSRPSVMQDFVMDRFLTKSSDALASGSGSAEEALKNEVRVDFFIPVLDTFSMSLETRFNPECTCCAVWVMHNTANYKPK